MIPQRRPTGNAVHLWMRDLDAEGDANTASLSPRERDRADAFVDSLARARFVHRRVLLRRVLAAYLGCQPASVVFETGPRGKPELAADAGLSFNASTSGGVAVIAVAGGSAIGVDVERRRPVPDAEAIARRFLAAPEAEWLAAQPADAHDDAFLALWTCNEAIVKASGRGLADGLRDFIVDCADPARPRVIGSDGIHLFAWTPAEATIAALATPFVATPEFRT